MKSFKGRMGKPLRRSTHEAYVRMTGSVINAMGGKSQIPSTHHGVHSAHGVLSVASKCKRENTTRYAMALDAKNKAVQSLDMVVANRKLSPPGKKSS
jgi:hypothetical protein